MNIRKRGFCLYGIYREYLALYIKEKILNLLEGNIEYTEWVEDDIAYVVIDYVKSANNIVDEIMRQLASKQ